MRKKTKKNENPLYSKFSSNIKRLNIELPNYKFFHSPSQLERNDKRFVGRKDIIDRFAKIITQNEVNSGAYLVTGYRGMGKSSFVNRVLNQITLNQQRFLNPLMQYFGFFFALYLLIVHFTVLDKIAVEISFALTVLAYVLTSILFRNPAFFSAIHFIRALSIMISKKEWKCIWKFFKRSLKKIWGFILNFRGVLVELINKRRRVVLKLNLGHEILDEKDILSLIAKNIERSFKQFAFSFRRQTGYYILKFALIAILTVQICGLNSLDKSKLTSYELFFPTQRRDVSNEKKFDRSFYIGLLQDTINNEKNIADFLKGNGLSIAFTSTELITQKGTIVKKKEGMTIQSTEVDTLKNGKSSSFFLQNIAVQIIRGINYSSIYLDWAYSFLGNQINEMLSKDLFSPHLNYRFWIVFFILNFLYQVAVWIMVRTPYLNFVSRKMVMRKLRNLNDHIDASIRMEFAANVGVKGNNGDTIISQKRSKDYPVYNIRQIEKSLIDIFDDINRMFFRLMRPEFIIVFDELDKIDPKTNSNLSNSDEDSAEFDISTSGITGGAATRIRKQNVLKLLANMKYFITTVKAKFIFISGRELYDAFLADVSDREFSISSIFHEVIYVESFLSDASDENRPDITSMAEHYVCQFLMPEHYIVYLKHRDGDFINVLTLKNYEHYLKEFVGIGDVECQKALQFLYQFIHYLTHVSNGAPKKISYLFERHVYSKSKTRNNDQYVGRKRAETYLSFGFYDQCKIGFIHYLSHPITMAITNNVSSYGDKLLVSASFLIDHIYKFHENGFSWRNLEHAPEVLDINHTPELRSFVNTIVNYLMQTHITPVVSGLYLFKFPMKISEEISFISKMSEEASAIFNFSLDESLSVKLYYEKMIQRLTKRYNAENKHGIKDGEYIHSIADIHHILGDLHLLDEEYTEAIFEYQNCLQYISRDFKDYDSHQATHLLFIVRSMLKLGLVFEKRKTFNSAYVTYNELASMLIDFRYINESKLGLEYKIEKTNNWTRKRAVLYKTYDECKSEEMNPFGVETKPQILTEADKDSIKFIAYGDDLIPSLARITTPLKNKLISRLTLFEDIRLMYQATLAKLFVLEKHQLGGITKSNLAVIESEFLNLHLATNLKDKFLISADFFKKLGDVMYYKNGLITKQSSTLFEGMYFWDYDIKDVIDQFCEVKGRSVRTNERLKRIVGLNIEMPRDLEIHLQNFSAKDVSKLKTKRFVRELLESERTRELLNEQLDESGVFDENERSKYLDDLNDFVVSEAFVEFDQFAPAVLCKLKSCNDRRQKLLNERHVAPCFACKFYNRSLEILSQNLLLNQSDEDEVSKAFIFLKALDRPTELYSQRNNYAQVLASTLGGFGDILVSCASEEEYIFDDFLDEFFKYTSDNSVSSLNRFKNRVRVDFDDKNKGVNSSFNKMFEHVVGLDWFRDDQIYKSKHALIYFKSLILNGYEHECDLIQNWINDVREGNGKITPLTSEDLMTEQYDSLKISAYIKNTDLNRFVNNTFKSCFTQENALNELQAIWRRGLSNLEKALLYYLASAKYYKRSSNLKETHAVYKKILQLLIRAAESKPIHKIWIKKYVENGKIKDEIVKRIFQSIYGAYEHIHGVEIQKLKWNETKELYEMLDFTELSLFPDLEETIYAYYELSIVCGCEVIDIKGKKNNLIETIYNLQSLSPYRLNSSIYNRLISLRFKVLLNKALLDKHIQGYKIGVDTYSPLHAIKFYQILKRKLNQKENLEETNQVFLMNYLPNCDEEKSKDLTIEGSDANQGENNQTKYLQVLEYLVLDSIFCLQKFIEVLFPNNRTFLFTNSYVAGIYKQLFEWTQLFDYLFMLYAYMDDDYPAIKNHQNEKDFQQNMNPHNDISCHTNKSDNIRRKLSGHCVRRIDRSKIQNSEARKCDENKDNKFLHDLFVFDGNVKSQKSLYINNVQYKATPDISDELTLLINKSILQLGESKKPIENSILNILFFPSKEFFRGKAHKFFGELEKSIGKSNTHLIDCNYLSEVGIKKYHAAFAMHQEGKPYKQMIDDMYYLNDDLDNDVLKFYLALERYHINVGDNYDSLRKLKFVCKKSQLYDVENYLKSSIPENTK